MARKKSAVKEVLEERKLKEPEDLKIFVAEADLVDLMTKTEGWQIIQRDFENLRKNIGEKLAYLNPKTPEFSEARITYIAIDKLLKVVLDYADNKRRVLELLEKIDNPQEIILDVDNET